MQRFFFSLLNHKKKRHTAFSLVEVVLALAIISVGLISIFALLPFGIEQDAISAKEGIAIGLMTQIESDLRNSPASSAASTVMGITPLPYQLNTTTNQVEPNAAITVPVDPADMSAVADANVTRLFFGDNLVAQTTLQPDSVYRATLRYTRGPGLGSAVSATAPDNPGISNPVPVEAHLMVSWPAILDPLKDTDRTNLENLVEVYLTFPSL